MKIEDILTQSLQPKGPKSWRRSRLAGWARALALGKFRAVPYWTPVA
jgi:hypothetical protein